MAFFVYVLHSDKLQKHYVGHTDDLEKRLSEHDSGKGKFTMTGTPWKFLFSFPCSDRASAMKLETKIKGRGVKRFLEDAKN